MIEELLYSKLAADVTLASLVADRIYPVYATEDDPLPLVVYTKESERPQNSTAGTGSFSVSTFTIDCYATTYASVKAVENAVRGAMATLAGQTGNNAIAQGVLLEESNDAAEVPFDSSGKPILHVAMTFIVQHTRT